MSALDTSNAIIDSDDLVLVTGATGFIGTRVVDALQRYGVKHIRCLVRPSCDNAKVDRAFGGKDSSIELTKGNLLSQQDCDAATEGVSVIYHLAAGTGTKSFADAFLNSVVTTRNLLEGVVKHGRLRRFVNVSSFTVYTNTGKPQSDVLDENCPIEENPALRGDSYCFAKVSQDKLVIDYGQKHRIPYVLVRPGVVYGPGKGRIHGRIGMGTFGIFVHLGGSNPIPLTFVDNCAEAIALAGLKRGVEGEVLNVVDDDLPSSKQFLDMYKKKVKHFPSLYIPHFLSYLFCLSWEKYSSWSAGQLPPIFNRKEWAASWKPTSYSNTKIKNLLGWTPKVSTRDGLEQYFASMRKGQISA